MMWAKYENKIYDNADLVTYILLGIIIVTVLLGSIKIIFV